jgi:hypothetical protein
MKAKDPYLRTMSGNHLQCFAEYSREIMVNGVPIPALRGNLCESFPVFDGARITWWEATRNPPCYYQCSMRADGTDARVDEVD